MTEQSGVCADGGAVSEVRLSESGCEPGGPGLHCAHQQSSGVEPACFYATWGFPSHHPLSSLLGLPGEPAPVPLEGARQVYKLSGPSEGPQAPDKMALGGQAHRPKPGKP